MLDTNNLIKTIFVEYKNREIKKKSKKNIDEDGQGPCHKHHMKHMSMYEKAVF